MVDDGGRWWMMVEDAREGMEMLTVGDAVAQALQQDGYDGNGHGT